jgi:hypothetical protein
VPAAAGVPGETPSTASAARTDVRSTAAPLIAPN